uniref:Uncharacterized protein n=1 Tax=Physcomitrium patens TaxID=3218 RepID=A0A2K1J6I9_PHYPA|nr:hypothetical protein PHYPA_020243 [Physcomitrium patens]
MYIQKQPKDENLELPRSTPLRRHLDEMLHRSSAQQQNPITFEPNCCSNNPAHRASPEPQSS